MVLARALSSSPKVLMLDEPTQGVDVRSRADIYVLINSSARAGMSVLVSSGDVEELAMLCDRVLVFGRGAVRSAASHEDLSPRGLTSLIGVGAPL